MYIYICRFMCVCMYVCIYSAAIRKGARWRSRRLAALSTKARKQHVGTKAPQRPLSSMCTLRPHKGP